jgi:hypothetical protein
MGATILLIGQECRPLWYYLEKILILESRFYCYEYWKVVSDEKMMYAPYLVIFHLSYRLGATNFIQPFFLCSEQEVSVIGSKSYLSLHSSNGTYLPFARATAVCKSLRSTYVLVML